MYRVAILFPIWKRPQMTDVTMTAINHMREYRADIEVIPIGIGSEGPVSQKAAYSKGWDYVEFPNQAYPKFVRHWNTGAEYAKKFDVDYIMLAQSDDFIEPEIMNVFETLMDKDIDFSGILDTYFWDTVNQKIKYWAGYDGARTGESMGPWRLLSKKLLDALDWEIFKENSRDHAPWAADGVLHDVVMDLMKGGAPITMSNFMAKDYALHPMSMKDGDNITAIELYEGKWLGDGIRTIHDNFSSLIPKLTEHNYVD